MASPIGLEASKYIVGNRVRFPGQALSLCFIGSLDWMPNIEGLHWFLRKVWPLLSAKYPDMSLHIAGRNTPHGRFGISGKQVVIHGEVPDASDFINRYDIMVVPLFSGSGMRVKILEGMALGKAIISTTLGKEGIDAQDREEIILADDAEAFVRAIDYCTQHPEVLSRIGRNARAFVKDHFDNHEITERLYDTYHQLVVGEHVH